MVFFDPSEYCHRNYTSMETPPLTYKFMFSGKYISSNMINKLINKLSKNFFYKAFMYFAVCLYRQIVKRTNYYMINVH